MKKLKKKKIKMLLFPFRKSQNFIISQEKVKKKKKQFKVVNYFQKKIKKINTLFASVY